MRKDILLPCLALGGGGAGFLLRRQQLASAYVLETGLFVPGATSTWLLLGLTALLALAFLLLVQGELQGETDYLSVFGSPEAGQMTALAAAGLLLLAAGALGLKEAAADLQLWRSAPGSYQVSFPAAQLAASVLCVPAGLGVLLMGRMAYRGELDGTACRLSSFPALMGLVWLFVCHLEHGTEPVLMRYGPSLFAICFLTLAHYYAAGALFGRTARKRTAFCALLGSVLGIVSLADRPTLFTAAATLAFSLSALALVRVLLRTAFGPPWPKRLMSERMPPLEEEEQDG